MEFEEELQNEYIKFARRKLGKCGKCKFINFNKYNGDTSRSRYYNNYCLVKKRSVGRIVFCKHFNRIKE